MALGERDYSRHTYEGDIDDPEVWQRLFSEVVATDGAGTGLDPPCLVSIAGTLFKYPLLAALVTLKLVGIKPGIVINERVPHEVLVRFFSGRPGQ